MKKLIISFVFLFLSVNFLLAQTEANSLIINSKSDIVEQVNSKIITFYIKGLSENELTNLSNKVSVIEGLKLSSLKETDANLKMALGKIEVQNNYDKKALESCLQGFKITKIVFEGTPTSLEKFLYKKETINGESK